MSGLSSFSGIAIRAVVGYVFVLAGLLKWLVADFTDRFEQIGMPYPEVSVLIVGTVEIICGSLLLFNLHVQKAVLPLFIVMAGAIGLTKIPLLAESGVWQFAFESRLDMVMIGLLIVLWREHKTGR